jgi:hypothetical protein
MVDDVEAEVEQLAVESGLSLEKGTYIEFQLVEHSLVDIATGVDKVAEELVLVNGLQMFV